MNMLQRKPATAVTLQLIACLVLVVLPHTTHLKPWVWLCFGIMAAWRAMAAIKHWPMPARWLRLLLALLAMLAVYMTYGSINGQQGGVALLIALLGMKLTELDNFRDHVVVALLAYFVLVSQFLFSQELVMVLWLIAGVWLITATLLAISHPQSALPYRTSIKRSASLLLQSVPMMLIFFLLFPRIPGPLWGLPADGGAGRSGLSNSMTPGDISNLATTDEIAFRVTFQDDAPPPKQRYWRGPVFEYFDGRSWRPASAKYRGLESEVYRLIKSGPDTKYTVTIEPNRERWLFALDMPTRIPNDAVILYSGLVLAKHRITERRLYQASSATSYQLAPRLSAASRQRNTFIPGTNNPRTRELARLWRSEGLDDRAIVQRILARFREDDYTYTLQPPRLGANPVDEFLLDTQKGFCEHFAGSFTFLMRAAGIPARIVTGYQGGEYNELGNYFIVRQSDAHAWTEVWLDNQGWVRVDPTAAVSPLRVETGLQSALPLSEAMTLAIARRAGDGLLYNIRMRWDWVNNSWYSWVLAYGPDLQNKLMEKFGITGWGQMILALTLLASLFLAGLGLILIWQLQRPAITDPVLKHWRGFSKKLAAHGLGLMSHEGPADYRDRLLIALPEQRDEIQHISQLYMRLRYGQNADNLQNKNSGPMEEFRQAIKRFRPRFQPSSH